MREEPLKSMISLFTLLTLLVLSLNISAHHSTAHYAADSTELEGEITDIRWVNPHIMYTLKTADERMVRMESGSVYYLERAGFSSDSLKVGDRVTAIGRVSTRGDTDMLLNRVVMENGDILPWSRDDLQAAFEAEDRIVDAATENKGLFRVWSIPANNRRETHTSLSALGQENELEYDPLDNWSIRCESGGMPRIMWFPHPIEFTDLGDEIRIDLEVYNLTRTVHMDQTSAPADFAGSALGYSVGRWEDSNTLVVTTTGINWGRYGTQGTPMSEEAVVVEQFTLSEDQTRVDFHIETTDPLYFNGPATVAAHWLAIGDEVNQYDCSVM